MRLHVWTKSRKEEQEEFWRSSPSWKKILRSDDSSNLSSLTNFANISKSFRDSVVFEWNFFLDNDTSLKRLSFQTNLSSSLHVPSIKTSISKFDTFHPQASLFRENISLLSLLRVKPALNRRNKERKLYLAPLPTAAFYCRRHNIFLIFLPRKGKRSRNSCNHIIIYGKTL